MNKLLLITILLTTLESTKILATQQRSVSPTSKAYQKSRELEEQRRQLIRNKIKVLGIREEETKQELIDKTIELNKLLTEKDAEIARLKEEVVQLKEGIAEKDKVIANLEDWLDYYWYSGLDFEERRNTEE